MIAGGATSTNDNGAILIIGTFATSVKRLLSLSLRRSLPGDSIRNAVHARCCAPRRAQRRDSRTISQSARLQSGNGH